MPRNRLDLICCPAQGRARPGFPPRGARLARPLAGKRGLLVGSTAGGAARSGRRLGLVGSSAGGTACRGGLGGLGRRAAGGAARCGSRLGLVGSSAGGTARRGGAGGRIVRPAVQIRKRHDEPPLNASDARAAFPRAGVPRSECPALPLNPHPMYGVESAPASTHFFVAMARKSDL